MSKVSVERGLHLEAFLEMLSAERGAARNTLDAYERDLKDFSAFLATRGKAQTEATARDIRDYLEYIAAQGLSASTAARRLSAIRQFHGFLFADGARKDDPCGSIEGPRRRAAATQDTHRRGSGRAAGRVAARGGRTDAGGGARLQARTARLPDGSSCTPACAMTEQVGLPLSAVRGDERFLSVSGKGGRERLVPLRNRAACHRHLFAIANAAAPATRRRPGSFRRAGAGGT